jgi:CRP-like cAMP-binding protein
VLHLLFNVQFFESFSRPLIAMITEHMRTQKFREGDVLMQKNELGECMFTIMSGDCGVYLMDEVFSAADAVVGPNKVIGEGSLLSDKDKPGKRTATIIALNEVTTLVL